jgi:hypothetical protein
MEISPFYVFALSSSKLDIISVCQRLWQANTKIITALTIFL